MAFDKLEELGTREIKIVFDYLGYPYNENTEPLELIKNKLKGYKVDGIYRISSYEFHDYLLNNSVLGEKMRNLKVDNISCTEFFQRVINWQLDCQLKEEEKENKPLHPRYDYR